MNAYNEAQSILVQDLINTFDLYLEQPEHLREPADLQRFLIEHHLAVTSPITTTTLDQVRSLREELRTIWTASDTADMTPLLNHLLALTTVTLQLTEEADEQLHLHFDLPSAVDVVQRLTFACALGIVGVVGEYGRDRMRACASAPCRDVFVDVSRNKTRRFCSDRCANRYNIAAFRDRHKGTD